METLHRCRFLGSTYEAEFAEARLLPRRILRKVSISMETLWPSTLHSTMGQTFRGTFHWGRVESGVERIIGLIYEETRGEGGIEVVSPMGRVGKCVASCVDITKAPRGASYNDFDIH